MESSDLDPIDERIIHGLIIDPRVSFRVLADVVGASPQTVARRYRRLQDIAALRVTGRVAAPLVGWVDWYVRMQCVPSAAAGLADALARRTDTTWVGLASGGAEVVCSVQARNPEQRNELLLEGLATSRRIVSLSAYALLYDYSPPAWPRLTQALDESACRRLSRPLDDSCDVRASALDIHDERLLDLLASDGRASSAWLASSIGWHESTIRRRIAELRHSSVLQFDVDIDPGIFGARTHAMVWASVDPAQLDNVGTAMARHAEAPFVSATTGSTNLMAAIVCKDTSELYHYLTGLFAPLPGIRATETSLLLRTVKRASPAKAGMAIIS
jgi:DNA-binding Lrp family transcriptional regulator